MLQDHMNDALKVAPPLTVAITSMAGVHWDTVSYIAATVYSVVMTCIALWSRVFKPWLDRRNGAS